MLTGPKEEEEEEEASFELDDVLLDTIFMACCDVSDVDTVTKFYCNMLIGFEIKNAKVNVCKTVTNVVYLNQKYSKPILVKSETICDRLFVIHQHCMSMNYLFERTIKHCMTYQNYSPYSFIYN
jgi:hypothetical protein